MADRTAAFFTSTGALQGISQTVPDNVLAGGLKRASGDVTIDAGGANSVLLRTNSVTSVTITSGGKLTTSSTTTTPALLIGSFAGDPSSLTNGDIWYNSSTTKFRARENGATVDLISAGTASGWTDDGAEIRLTTSTDEVTVGPAAGTAGKFTVVGDTVGQKTIVAKQVAAQTAAALTIQNSAGTDLYTVTGLTSILNTYSRTVNSVFFITDDEVAGGGAGGSWSFTTGTGGDAVVSAAGASGSVSITIGQGGNAGTVGGETAAIGGTLTITGGQGGTGDAAGTGGLNGGNGSAFIITSGAGGTSGSGGAAGFGGAITIKTGDAGTVGGTFGITPGNGGLLTLRGGVGSTGDSASFAGIGGGITLIGGIGGLAFSGGSTNAGPGGDVSLTGGVGGDGNVTIAATGGGSIFINGGVGGVDNGGGGGPGGDVTIRGGNATGSNTDGTLSLGDANTSALTIAATSIVTTVNGPIRTTSTATLAGLRFGSVAGDPSTLSNGDVWYNTSTAKFRARENGATVDIIGTTSAAGWTDDGAEIRLTTSTDEVTVGPAAGTAGKFTVVGDTVGQKVAVIKMVASQSANAFEVQSSAGVTCFAVDITGSVQMSAGPSGVTGSMRILAGQASPGVRWDRLGTGVGQVDITHTAALTLDVTASTIIQPATDNTGQLGATGKRWNLVRATTVTTGDLVMDDPERGVSWRLREELDCITATNQITGKKYKLMMEELPG